MTISFIFFTENINFHKKLKRPQDFSFIIFYLKVFFFGILSLNIMFFHMFQMEAHIRLQPVTHCPLAIHITSIYVDLGIVWWVT